MKLRSLAVTMAVVFALTGCAHKPRASELDRSSADADAPLVAPTRQNALNPADDNLNAVAWVQTAVEYDAITLQTYRSATDLLDRALKDPSWNALVPEERGSKSTPLPPAVVVDVDETVLDNSPYQARLVLEGAEYSEVTWDAWVTQKRAKAVPGAVEFARAAAGKGVTVLYLSNRATHLKDATLQNLRDVGLPVKDDSVFLGLGLHVDGCEQHGSEKSCRRQLVATRYRVLMQIGDQLGDFVQISSNTPEGRAALYAQYREWFGQRWWMLPNPTYGSWEPALFNNDFRQPRDARRDAKRRALDPAR